jgi:hypothetical protein
MANGKPLLLRSARASYRYAGECFVGLLSASLVASVVELLSILARGEPEDGLSPAFLAWNAVITLIEAAALSPFAVLIHRRIILRDGNVSYWNAATSRNTHRFILAALAVSMLEGLDGLVVAIGQPASLGWSLAWVLLLAVIGIATGIFGLRLLLMFPAIATEGSAAPLRDSLHDTKGSVLRILAILFVALLPISLLDLGFDTIEHSDLGYILARISHSLE